MKITPREHKHQLVQPRFQSSALRLRILENPSD